MISNKKNYRHLKYWEKMLLASESNLPYFRQKQIAESPREMNLKSILAANASVEESIQEKLLSYNSVAICQNLAGNPNSSLKVQLKLLAGENNSVLCALAKNTVLEKVQEALLSYNYLNRWQLGLILKKLALNTALHPKIQLWLIDSNNEEVWCNLIKLNNLTLEVQRKFLEKEPKFWEWLAAENPNLFLETQLELAKRATCRNPINFIGQYLKTNASFTPTVDFPAEFLTWYFPSQVEKEIAKLTTAQKEVAECLAPEWKGTLKALIEAVRNIS